MGERPMTNAERMAKTRAKKREEVEQMAREAETGRSLMAHLKRLRTAFDHGDMVLTQKIMASMEKASFFPPQPNSSFTHTHEQQIEQHGRAE